MTTENINTTGLEDGVTEYPDGCDKHLHCLTCPQKECFHVDNDWLIRCAEWDGLIDTCKGGIRGRLRINKRLPQYELKKQQIVSEWKTGKYKTRRELAKHLNLDHHTVERAIKGKR